MEHYFVLVAAILSLGLYHDMQHFRVFLIGKKCSDPYFIPNYTILSTIGNSFLSSNLGRCTTQYT